MSKKQVAIGADVKAKGGHSIGKVEHLIFDGTTNSLAGFVADKGIFDSGRVVDLIYVASVSEEVVELTLTDEEAKNLPGFVQQEFVRFGQDAAMNARFGETVNIGASGNQWMHYGPGAGGGMASTGAESLFGQGVIGQVDTQVVGPLTDSDIVLDNGTDVVDREFTKLGVIDDIIIGDDNKVQGFIVQQGHLFHHDVYVPFEWIEAVTHDHVRLNVLKGEVEQSKTAAGSSGGEKQAPAK